MIGQKSHPVDKRIWTIGHGTESFDSVATALAEHGAQTIVDVRSEPYSQRAPDFVKADLEEAAASAGFGYRWMGRTLGGRPQPTPQQLASGLDELDGLAATSHVALLCAESDPVRCHRDSLLAPALAARGYEIIHILRDGSTTPFQARFDLDT